MAYQSNSYKKFVATAATATLVATAVVPATFAAEVKPAAFSDVGASYEAAVNFVIANNIAKGLSETQFGVQSQIKRGDVAIMIANAANLNNEDAPSAGFTDVPKRGALAINSLKAAGVVNGKTATNFGFEDSITRGEAAIMLTNAFDLEGNVKDLKFTDVSDRYDEAVAALVANKVTQGINATQFGTENPIKRGDFAKFLFALEEYIVDQTTTPAATAAVVKAETSLLEADYAAAVKVVAALPASDAKTLLEARLAALEDLLADLLEAINETDGELDLYNALNDAKIKNVVADYADEYSDALDADGTVFETLAEVQEYINTINAGLAVEAFNALVDGTDVTSSNFDLEDFYKEVADVEKAINAVDANEEGSKRGTFLAQELEKALDELVEYVENYVDYVAAVVDADTEVELYNALKAGFKNVVADNVDEYEDYLEANTVDTIEDVQFAVDYVNADEAINDFDAVDADTTQKEIDALTNLVKRIADQDADSVEDLYDDIEAIQAAFDALVDAEAKYAATVAKAEDALVDYVEAGGSVNDDVYFDLDEAIADEAPIGELTDLLADIEAATEELVAYDEAVEAAEAALDAYVAADGDVEADAYVNLGEAIEAEAELTVLEGLTDILEDITEDLVIVADINDASTATELQAALAELELAGYDNLPLVQRVEVANRLLDVVADGDYDTFVEVEAGLVPAISNAITTYTNDLAAVKNSETIVAVDTELERLDLGGYNDLTAAEQLVVAENVLNNIPTDEDGTVTGYTSLSQIIAQF